MPAKFTNQKQFIAAIDNWSKGRLREEVWTAMRVVALDILSEVVEETPVDTGRARGNWQITIDKSPSGETGKTDKDGGDTENAGLMALGNILNRPLGVIFITNNVKYISELEKGSSQRGGKHMLRNAFERARGRFVL